MAVKKKTKIIVISSISTIVLVLGLGVGLWLGLPSKDNGNQILNVTNSSLPSGKPYQIDKKNKKVKIDEKEYDYREENGDKYIIVPEIEATFNEPKITVANMFNKGLEKFQRDENNQLKIGEGKDYFYKIPYFGIEVVKITNDGKIWAGFESTTTGYRLKTMDSQATPVDISNKLPYEVGSFDDDGSGGLNMLKVERYLALIDDDGNTKENEILEETDIKWKLFKNIYTGDFIVYIGTMNNITDDNARPSTNIAFYPTSDSTDPASYIDFVEGDFYQYPQGYDANNPPPIPTTKKFMVTDYKQRNGNPITFEWKDNEPANKEFSYLLKNMYIPIKIDVGGMIYNDVLGTLEALPSGKVLLPENFISLDGTAIDFLRIREKSSTITLPSFKIKLEKPIYRDDQEGLFSNKRLENELLINVQQEWLTYFEKIAHDPIVVWKARELGITIKFKTTPAFQQINQVLDYGYNNPRAPEVFFLEGTKVDLLNKNGQLKPLKYQLKTNLDDSSKFVDSWRDGAKIKEGQGVGEYGFYPLSENTQVIAYNSDYLPNGFDVLTKDISDYLYQGDLGTLATVQAAPTADVSTEAGNGLLALGNFDTSAMTWAYNYYGNTKLDQVDQQQDIIWKKAGTENDYWSVFADAGLKDDIRFQKWVDHYKNSNQDVKNNKSYALGALFNGHIGGIVIDSAWASSHNQDWINGRYRAIGSDDEKKAFVKDKIKFQSLPNALSNRWYVAMVSSINDPKQQLAETFLDTLLNPMKMSSSNFLESISGYLPRIDVDRIEGQTIMTNLKETIARTNTITKTGLPLPNFILDIWSRVVSGINQQSDYTSIANALRDELLANPKIENLFDPTTGTISPTS